MQNVMTEQLTLWEKRRNSHILVKDRLWLTDVKYTISRTWSTGYVVTIEIKQ